MNPYTPEIVFEKEGKSICSGERINDGKMCTAVHLPGEGGEDGGEKGKEEEGQVEALRLPPEERRASAVPLFLGM
jgi:hypothetical protein